MGQDQSCCGGNANSREHSRNNEDFGSASKPRKQSENVQREDVQPGPDLGSKADLEAALPVEASAIDEARRSSEKEARSSKGSVQFAEVEPTTSDTLNQGQTASGKSEETFRAMDTKEAFVSFAPGLASEEHRDAAEESEQRKRADIEDQVQNDDAGASEKQKRENTLAAELEEPQYNTSSAGKVAGISSTSMEAEHASNDGGNDDRGPEVKADTPEVPGKPPGCDREREHADNTDAVDTKKKKPCCVMM